VIRVAFVGEVQPGLGWVFEPCQKQVCIRPGQSTLVFYTATNKTDQDIIGVSTYNVAPPQARPCYCSGLFLLGLVSASLPHLVQHSQGVRLVLRSPLSCLNEPRTCAVCKKKVQCHNTMWPKHCDWNAWGCAVRRHLSGLKERSMLRGMHRFFGEVMHSTSPSSCSSRDTPNTVVPSILAGTILAVVYHTAFVVFRFQFHSTGPQSRLFGGPHCLWQPIEHTSLGYALLCLLGRFCIQKFIRMAGHCSCQKAGNAAPGNTSPQECMCCLMFLNKRPAMSD
jgi:hypothetical protein